MVSSPAGQLAVDVTAVQDCLHTAWEAVSTVLLADPGNRAEAKSWLTTTIAHLKDVTLDTKLVCFSPVGSSSSSSSANRAQYESPCFDSRHQNRSGISSSDHRRNEGRDGRQDHSSRRSRSSSRHQRQPSPISACRPATLQLLQLLIDAQPAAVAQLLSHDSNFLCNYLTSNSSVTSSWFNHFSLSGFQNFKFGSRALANYALTHRSDIWQYLVWSGKHDQAPVAVAAKPHYFSELDVPRTLRNLAKYCPEFWQSDELLRSCEGGEWLRLNSELINEVLYDLLHNSKSSRHHQVLQLLNSYILSADWSFLSNRLLLLLSEQQLMDFVKLVAQQQQQQPPDDGGFDSRQRQQQQQQRADKPQHQQHSSSQSVLLQQYVQQQTTYDTKAVAVQVSATSTAAAAPAPPPPPPPPAAAASELPCVSSLPLLVLAVAQQCSTFDQVLLANALSCFRSQLLTLLQQQDSDDVALQLLQLVKAAQQLFNFQQQQQQDAEDTAAAASCGAILPVVQYLRQQVLAVVKQDAAATPQQQLPPLLLLLLVGWLLRLHLLLAAAGGGVQLSDVLRQLGCECQVLLDSSVEQQQQQQQQQVLQLMDLDPAQQTNTGKGSQQQDGHPQPQQQQHPQHMNPQQQQQQQHAQHIDPQQQQQHPQQIDPQQQQHLQHIDPQQQQQHQHQQQHQEHQHIDPQHQDKEQPPDKPHRPPLRRGQSAAEQQHQQQGHKLKLKRKHSSGKHHRNKQHCKTRKRRHTSSNSEPESDSQAANSTASDAEKGRRRRSGKRRKQKRPKHNRKHERSRRTSSSSGNDSEDGSEINYDAGGKLLDPASFTTQSFPSLYTNDASAVSVDAPMAQLPTVAVAECGEARLTAYLTAEQQKQLSDVLGGLASLSIGGQLHLGPKWLLGLPSSSSSRTASKPLVATAVAVGSSSVVEASTEESCYVWHAGLSAEVADVAAWYCISRWMIM